MSSYDERYKPKKKEIKYRLALCQHSSDEYYVIAINKVDPNPEVEELFYSWIDNGEIKSVFVEE